jgi:membrane fusion protein (multidrug efflux system)
MTIPISNALIIPQKATYEIQDKIYVYVVDKDNVVKSKNISIKNSLSNLYVVGDGLSADDKILIEGIQSAKEDGKIEYEYMEPKNAIYNLQLIKQ